MADASPGLLQLQRLAGNAVAAAAVQRRTEPGDGQSTDIMHFNMRGLGPIRKIVKTVEGQTVSLGNG